VRLAVTLLIVDCAAVMLAALAVDRRLQYTGADGACRRSQGGICLSLWTYTGLASDLQTQCAAAGGTWVNP
jgi:hypothetical protein